MTGPGALRVRRLALLLLLLAAAGCARPRVSLPGGPGTPFAGFEAAYEQAVQECRDARTVLAELGLSGRAGSTKLRGRVTAGLAAPDNVRLEGVAFGRPVFFLVARGGDATLLLPRDERVVRNAPPEAIIEALTGVALTPSELRSAVAGCGLGTGMPAGGRRYSDEWAAVDVDGEPTYLRRIEGRWRVGGAARGPLMLQYAGFAGGRAATIMLRAQETDITLRVSQLEVNTPIDPKAFELDVPADAAPLSLEELRQAGPLGERRR